MDSVPLPTRFCVAFSYSSFGLVESIGNFLVMLSDSPPPSYVSFRALSSLLFIPPCCFSPANPPLVLAFQADL